MLSRGCGRIVAVAMKKIIECLFCCCRGCHRGFDRLSDYLGHLSVDGFCRGTADRVVREISRIVSSCSRHALYR